MRCRERPIRIGQINFTNVWPISYFFPLHELGDTVELISQVPSGLNEAMAKGSIHIGPISSYAYGEHADDYLLLPDLSISSFGRVNSIYLFHKKPFEQILFGDIALPTTSATSVNLLKILIEYFYGGKPSYRYASPSLADMMLDADAALLIGDDAIKAKWAFPQYEVIDLGERWTSLTGHWMSFAVWAVRRDIAESEPDIVESVYNAFLKSKQMGQKKLGAIVSAAVESIGGSPSFWQDYFSQLNYDFDQAHWNGLRAYFQLAWKLGLIHREIPLNIWSNHRTVQVNE